LESPRSEAVDLTGVIAVLANIREMGMVFTFAPGMELPAQQKCRA
jgi:hypothetical protein